MSEGNGDKLKEEPINASGDLHAEPPKDQPLKMEITFTADKGISVLAPGNGTFYNMPMCLFLLDGAKDFIKMANHSASKPIVEHPPVNIINRMKNFGNGAFGKKH